jgi:hypothetical protein
MRSKTPLWNVVIVPPLIVSVEADLQRPGDRHALRFNGNNPGPRPLVSGLQQPVEAREVKEIGCRKQGDRPVPNNPP